MSLVIIDEGKHTYSIPNTLVKPSVADGSAASLPCESKLLPVLRPVPSDGRHGSFHFQIHLIPTNQYQMGNLKKKRRLKMNKHKRRKRTRANRHKKRDW